MDITIIEKRVEKLYEKWLNYHRGILCGPDGRRAVVDSLSCYEEEILVLLSRSHKNVQKAYKEKMSLFKAWRESANWILREE